MGRKKRRQLSHSLQMLRIKNRRADLRTADLTSSYE
jgi:hypothetical protein